MQAARTQIERSDATRRALIDSARNLFGSRGYAAVPLDEVVSAAGVTKGALYHHFPGGKKDLMEALYETVEADFTERVTAGIAPRLAEGEVDPLDIMGAAIEETLDLSMDPELQQILLLDSLAVLGRSRWREIAHKYSLAVVKSLLAAAVEHGSMKPLPTESLANLLMAALSEAILMIPRAGDQEQAKADASRSLKAIIDGLRA